MDTFCHGVFWSMNNLDFSPYCSDISKKCTVIWVSRYHISFPVNIEIIDLDREDWIYVIKKTMLTSTDRWTYKWQDIGACVYNNIHTCTMAYDLGFGFIARKIMCLNSMCSNYKLGSQNSFNPRDVVDLSSTQSL